MNKIVCRFKKIAENRSDGAAQLAKQACQAIAEFAKQGSEISNDSLFLELDQIAQALRSSQPDMAPLTSLSRKIVQMIERNRETEAEKDAILQQVSQLAANFQKQLTFAKSAIAEAFVEMIEHNDRILTYSMSSTVKHCLLFAHKKGKQFHVLCLESRPRYEGVALAKKLGQAGIACSLAVDAAAFQLLEQARFIAVGADCVTAEYFVNKIGTRSLALGAKEISKKIFVLADLTKFVPASWMPSKQTVGPVSEVLLEHPRHVCILNPYFEKIPLHHITGIITEKGCFSPEVIPELINQI